MPAVACDDRPKNQETTRMLRALRFSVFVVIAGLSLSSFALAADIVWASYFALPSFAISWKTTHAGVSKSGDMGYTSGTYQDSYADADGKTVRETGKYVCVWAKQKDG